MEGMKIDTLDLKLIYLLMDNSRLSISELALLQVRLLRQGAMDEPMFLKVVKRPVANPSPYRKRNDNTHSIHGGDEP